MKFLWRFALLVSVVMLVVGCATPAPAPTAVAELPQPTAVLLQTYTPQPLLETTRRVTLTPIPTQAGMLTAIPTVTNTPTPTATPTATLTPTPSPTRVQVKSTGPFNVNLFPNASFDDDWYFAGFSELQIPIGWQVYTNEGINDLVPGSGGVFLRPEIRVVPFTDLPPTERALYIFNGEKTIKAFKGGAPTNFAIFTDISLTPGRYRMTLNFFPDTVAQYNGGQKIFVTDSLGAEMYIVHNNRTADWQPVQIGQRNTVTYEFNVGKTGIVRLGGGFRNRFIAANNGWFLDDWILVKIN